MSNSSSHRIVIVGGGAGGLELATKLGDTFGKSGRVEVTLVDKSRTHIWKPLLHAIAAGSLRRSQHELNYLAQAHWHNFRFRLGELAGLDREARTIQLAALRDDEGAQISPPSTIPYDTLVIAIGSITNDFGTPGAAEFAVPLETPEQASRFNRRLVNAMLKAQHQESAITPGQLHRRGRDGDRAFRRASSHRPRRHRLWHGQDRRRARPEDRLD
jgi:NADH dehydrogenase